MALQAEGAGPYAPPSGVIEIAERFRDRGLQTPITTDVLERAGIPESLSQRTLQTLRIIDFVGADGQPSPELQRLSRVRDDDEWKQGLRDLLTAAYADIFSYVDPAKDSIEKVRGAFRAYNPRGQQERMVTLFLGLCEWAGIDVTAATAGKKKAGAVDKPSSNGAAEKSRPPQQRKKGSATSAKPRMGASAPPDPLLLPPGLVGLLQQIPRGGTGWTQETRNNFVAAFTAVLDFTVPIRPIGLEDLTDDDLEEADSEDEP